MTRAAALWTARQAAKATGGRAGGDFRAMGVAIDSRAIRAGDLFVAVRGPNHDGHDFVAEALDRGAAGAIVGRIPKGASDETRLVFVDDTREALYALAREARRRHTGRVAAITGSVGKTGTKDALGTVLSRQAKTTASLGNLNNEWGAPLSLARMPADAAYGVFELGMSRPGEIAPLSRLMHPDVAVITTIAAVHMAYFSSTFDIADAKAEIFEGMSGGVGVLHRDNPYFPVLVAAACVAGVERVMSFGAHPEATARLMCVDGEDGGQRVSARIDGRPIDYQLSVPGRHWVMISLAVLCAVIALGADLAQAAEALGDVQAPAGRGRQALIRLPTGELQLIDESYNASPAAVRAAIETLAGVTPGGGGRRIAVLGDMLELGPNSAAIHAALLETLARSGIDLVFTTGNEMEHLHDVLPPAMRGEHAATARDLAPLVAAAVRAGDVVSVKGSRGIRTEQVVEALAALAAPRRCVANHG